MWNTHRWPVFCDRCYRQYPSWMNGEDVRVCAITTLVHIQRAHVRVSVFFLWMTVNIRSADRPDNRFRYHLLGHCLNTRYKNCVLLRFTAPPLHEYRWDVSNNGSLEENNNNKKREVGKKNVCVNAALSVSLDSNLRMESNKLLHDKKVWIETVEIWDNMLILYSGFK